MFQKKKNPQKQDQKALSLNHIKSNRGKNAHLTLSVTGILTEESVWFKMMHSTPLCVFFFVLTLHLKQYNVFFFYILLLLASTFGNSEDVPESYLATSYFDTRMEEMSDLKENGKSIHLGLYTSPNKHI